MALRNTLASVGLPLDARGLVELSTARRMVCAANEFRRGEGRAIAGTWVWDSERLWACLLSLEDAAEFVREATRIRWCFHPRAHQNLEPFERYGSDIWPWLMSFARSGVLHNVPWCVLPLLKRLGDEAALGLLLEFDAVVTDEGRFPGPFSVDGPGDVDVKELVPSRAAAEQALLDFVTEHAELSLPILGERSARGDERAAAFLGSMEPDPVSEESILAALDDSCRGGESWPVFFAVHPDRAYHALRLVVFTETDGNGWLVVFECLEGSYEETLCVRRYVQTAPVQTLLDHVGGAELFVDGAWQNGAENTLLGPCGDLSVSDEALLDLEPLRSTATDAHDLHFTLLVRAYVQQNPEAFWSDADALLQAIVDEGGDVDGYDVLFESSAFEHILGPAGAEYDPDGIDAQWRKLPSESAVYQSLARAIVARDGDTFEPGESNLDWRLHLEAPRRDR